MVDGNYFEHRFARRACQRNLYPSHRCNSVAYAARSRDVVAAHALCTRPFAVQPLRCSFSFCVFGWGFYPASFSSSLLLHMSFPRSEEQNFTAANLRRSRAASSDCKTQKDKSGGASARCVGLFAASFCGCGLVGFLREVAVAESLSFAVRAVAELAEANPALTSLGYDDGCHLAELLRRHPDARLRTLDVWIDLFHLCGHVRQKCFLQHNPMTRVRPEDRVTLHVRSDTCRRRLLSHLDSSGKVLRARSLQSRLGWLWQGGRGRSMRLYCVGNLSCMQTCHALAEFAAAALPLHIEVTHPAHLRPFVLQLSTQYARSRFLSALDILSGQVVRVIHINKVRLPRRARLVAWWTGSDGAATTKHALAASLDLVKRVEADPIPFSVTFIYGQNTSVAEQNWVYFNKFRHTLRSMGRGEYLLFAHRIAHLRNALLVSRL